MEQTKKYELTEETYVILTDDIILHRIRALRDFGNVKAGDLGGWVQSEKNLAQYGSAWVYGNAKVYDDARVYGDAKVYGDARVHERAHIYGSAHVCGYANIDGNACVHGCARVYCYAHLYGHARAYGSANISGYACVCGNAVVSDSACVYGGACVCGDTRVRGGARVCGDVNVKGNACVSGSARVSGAGDYATVKGFGRGYRTTTFFRRQDGSVGVQCGCFYGSLQEFRWQVRKTHGDSKMAKEYLAIADLMELHFTKEGGEDHGADKEV